MVELQRINPDWAGDPCIVAATGPSLTADVVHRVRMARWIDRWQVIAVQDAYKVMPWADALYGCNPSWWRLHRDCAGFQGEKWSTHEVGAHLNDKSEAHENFGVRVCRGTDGKGFSLDPELIHYGSNSGFQAINLALLRGCKRIVLVGFDMRYVDGRSHFFGDHPKGILQNEDAAYRRYVPHFARAAKLLSPDVLIVNATLGSALDCFPQMALNDALKIDLLGPNGGLHCYRPEPHAATG